MIIYEDVISNLEEMAWDNRSLPLKRLFEDELYYLKKECISGTVILMDGDDFTPTGEVDCEPDGGVWVQGWVWVSTLDMGVYQDDHNENIRMYCDS